MSSVQSDRQERQVIRTGDERLIWPGGYGGGDRVMEDGDRAWRAGWRERWGMTEDRAMTGRGMGVRPWRSRCQATGC
ncbi:MAG TPA: hypothetical protein VHD83_01630 [Puia sp.]|nr:hypothetical protein [Puia sp.]